MFREKQMLDDQVHAALFSDATLKLGEIHGALLKSAHIMDKERWVPAKTESGFTTHEWTEFGNQVGRDEINWWIVENENNLDELLAITEEALNAVQVLKTDSAKLKNKEPESYKALLVDLKEFAEQNGVDIDALDKYVGLVEERHPMAPRILFTYRVWGSTRMADREMNLDGEEAGKWKEKTLRALAEIALGVRERGDLVYWDKYNEIGFEIYESLDPETTPPDYEIIPPEPRVVRRTADAVYDKCATYFLEIRDSLRNIKLDIEKFKEQQGLYASDEFWRTFITKASQVKTAEPQLWDFKETLTVWHVKNDPERRQAKVALAEDVASLANTSGGVLVVGVNDKREVVGIGDGRRLENRLKVARDVLEEFLEYGREIVTFRQVGMGENRDMVCLVIVVSQACSSVGASDVEARFSYPVLTELEI